MLQKFAQIWTGPISNTFIILGAIILLYPIIWRLTNKQLNALMQALDVAKKLPDTIAALTAASDQLEKINREFSSLEKSLDTVIERIDVVNRNVTDLQISAESQPPTAPEQTGNAVDAAVQAVTDSEIDNWEYVSKVWQQVKAVVEARIASISDGRKRRPYDTMSRYNYSDVALSLFEDGYLTKSEAEAISHMDEVFRSTKNRRIPITPDIKNSFSNWSKKLLRNSK